MLDKEESSLGIYDYGCLGYNSKSQICKTCDGFGRNLNTGVKVEKCYTTKEQMKEDLDLNRKPFIN